VHETCRAFVKALMKQYIKFPSGDEIDCVIDEFSTRRGVPQCFGAVDGCHIPVCASNEQHANHYNRKGWCSMICSRTCGCKLPLF